MHKEQLSFRTEISGRIASLLMDAGMSSCAITRNGLAAIIDSLSSYQEEGQKLYPKIILTENMQAVKLMLPQSETINIASGPLSIETYQKCLKKCAPLASGEWYIFIERAPAEVRFGLIRVGDGVISSSVFSLLRDFALYGTATPMIVIRRVADRTVEATTSNNHSLLISFSGKVYDEVNTTDRLNRLFSQISMRAGVEVQEKLPILLERIFNGVLERGHGTLAIVVGKDFEVLEVLKDGTWLTEPIDLASKVNSIINISDAEAVGSARAVTEIVAGMLMSDGITVFDNAGRILGFNVFARSNPISEGTGISPVTGGARRRTFAQLSSWVGNGLEACFMISHDGDTAYYDIMDKP